MEVNRMQRSVMEAQEEYIYLPPACSALYLAQWYLAAPARLSAYNSTLLSTLLPHRCSEAFLAKRIAVQIQPLKPKEKHRWINVVKFHWVL